MHLRLPISDLWNSHGPYVYAGTTSGFSVVSIAETVRGYPLNAWASALLSIVATYLSWRLTERTRRQKLADAAVHRTIELQRDSERVAREDRREEERRKRESVREKALLDLVSEVREMRLQHVREPEPTTRKRSHL